MLEPVFDTDGYPTDATLDTIEEWKCESLSDYHDLMDYIGRGWHWPDMFTKEEIWDDSSRPVVAYVFSTGGWSGNESLVGALQGNVMAQMIGAYSWKRGGHYEYRFPIEKRTY